MGFLKKMEEEDLIFMNSIHCFSYFWSFKRFPGHQQKLPNTSGALCKLMARWGRSPTNELFWLTGICQLQSQWIQGEKGGEKEKTSPQIANKKGGVKSWPTGSMMAIGQDFTPRPYISTPSFCITHTGHFLTVDFF